VQGPLINEASLNKVGVLLEKILRVIERQSVVKHEFLNLCNSENDNNALNPNPSIRLSED